MDALILMTRMPIPGKTKTRLLDVLSGVECARLHTAFLKDLFNIFNILNKDIDIYVYFTPSNSLHIINDILPKYVKTFSQKGNSLGDKMFFGFNELFDKGYKKVVLTGGDIPEIQPKDILSSLAMLDKSDIVIGPTMDGGYYLIGMKEANSKIFNDDVKWGNKSVFEATVDIVKSQNLKMDFAKKLLDIDIKEDLDILYKKIEYLKKELDSPPYETIKYLKEIWRA